MVGEGSPVNAPSGFNTLQSFSDATAGRSLQLFYALQAENSTSIDYILCRDSGVSNPTMLETTTSIDKDFDITINKPTIIAGIASMDFKLYANFTAGSSGTVCQITATIYHYNGSTETSLGSQTSPTLTDPSGVAGAATESFKLKIPLSKKLFGVGDILRLNIVVTRSGDTGSAGIYTDAQTAGNELKLWVPIVNLE